VTPGAPESRPERGRRGALERKKQVVAKKGALWQAPRSTVTVTPFGRAGLAPPFPAAVYASRSAPHGA